MNALLKQIPSSETPFWTAERPPEDCLLRRFTVDEYHLLAEWGLFAEDERFELLDGWIVKKMTRHPPHHYVICRLIELFGETLPNGYFCRSQAPIRLAASEPEPDLAVVAGLLVDFKSRHPTASETPLIVEVADSSHGRDRRCKRKIFAENGVPEYWIVNLVDRMVEIYSSPDVESKIYKAQQEFNETESVPFRLQDNLLAEIPVRDILP